MAYEYNSFTAKLPGDPSIFYIRYNQATGQALMGADPLTRSDAITYEEVTFMACHRKSGECMTSGMFTVIVEWIKTSDIVLSKIPWAASFRYPAD